MDQPDHSAEFEAWLNEARQGSQEALGLLLESYRTYLLLIANEEIDGNLRRKVAASDLVQDTFVDVRKKFGNFRGKTEQQWKKWIRQVLLHDLQDARRRYSNTEKRKISREVSLHAPANTESRNDIDVQLDSLTPRAKAIAQEELLALQKAMETLSSEYRQVIQLRNWKLLSFEQIGQEMDRSAEAARKLWSRAIEQLERELTK